MCTYIAQNFLISSLSVSDSEYIVLTKTNTKIARSIAYLQDLPPYTLCLIMMDMMCFLWQMTKTDSR